MTVTTLGSEVCHILESHCPTLVATNLTRELEARMVKIQENKESGAEVLTEVTGILKTVLGDFKQNEKVVGQQLAAALEISRLEEMSVGAWPVCKSGRLAIYYSKKTRKGFIG